MNQHAESSQANSIGFKFDDAEEPLLPEQKPTPLPWKPLISLLFIVISEPLCLTLFYPYMYFLIRDFKIAPKEEDIGIYAGLLAASFSLAQLLTCLFWGAASDRIGRKPVLMFGLIGNVLALIGFGLSPDFYTALVFRLLNGMLNGNMGVAKSVIAEITDDSNASTAFGLFNLTWSLGGILGPVIGGYLNHPAEKISFIFGHSEFFKKFPYFLPPLVSATLSTIGFLVFFFWFHETKLPNRHLEESVQIHNDTSAFLEPQQSNIFKNSLRQSRVEDSNSFRFFAGKSKSILDYQPLNRYFLPKTKRPRFFSYSHQSLPSQQSSDSHSRNPFIHAPTFRSMPEFSRQSTIRQPTEPLLLQQSSSNQSYSILTKLTLLTILCYSILAFGNNILDEIYNLWIILPPPLQYQNSEPLTPIGLGFTSELTGLSLAILGALDVLFQIFCYPWLRRKIGGDVPLFRLSMLILAVTSILLPFTSYFGYQGISLNEDGNEEGLFYKMSFSVQMKVWALLIVVTGLKTVFQLCAYTTIMLMINNSVMDFNYLGFVNGVSQTSASLVRCIGPALAGLMWSWSLQSPINVYPLNHHFVFVLIAFLFLIGFLLGFKLPSALSRKMAFVSKQPSIIRHGFRDRAEEEEVTPIFQ